VPLADMHCPACGTQWPVEHGIADFSRGAYYDVYAPDHISLERDREGWAMEMEGSRRRIADFYEPLLRREGARRVLDSGCGNGVSVDLLNEYGYDAWGNDLSQLRQFQWRERRERERLVVASSLRLPFADMYFDAVISSGVIEHIGVVESALPRYSVAPLPDRDAQRAAFLTELFRVTRPGGVVFIDCPNGAFPIDFWHGDQPGGPRLQSRDEGFLPTFAEIRALAGGMNVDALSPYKRLQFHQARRHWYGRLLGPFANAFFASMRVVPWLARTAINPFLVVRVTVHPEQ
jgi:SAM-dependent methyltransferase